MTKVSAYQTDLNMYKLVDILDSLYASHKDDLFYHG